MARHDTRAAPSLGRVLSVGVSAIAVTAVSLLPTSIAAGAAHQPTRASAVQCTSTSLTGTKPSKYNTTPKGKGPWHVPLDPCNTEATTIAEAYSNCAYWAAEKRPDLWTNAVWKYGYPSGGAWSIKLDAKKAGYSINHRPKVGDIAAWPDNATMGHTAAGVTFTASPGGHVGYVEKVRSHGRITFSQMGTGATGGVTTTMTFNKKQTFFIHRHH